MSNVNSFLINLKKLDLEMIKIKLMDEVEGQAWTKSYADTAADEYCKFLALTAAYPNLAIVPSGPVDTFWHNHILDTQKYGPDCEKTLGYFVHHFPYFGMRSSEDANNLETSWLNTTNLYRQHFGEPPTGFWDSGTRCPKCGREAPYALPRTVSTTTHAH